MAAHFGSFIHSVSPTGSHAGYADCHWWRAYGLRMLRRFPQESLHGLWCFEAFPFDFWSSSTCCRESLPYIWVFSNDGRACWYFGVPYMYLFLNCPINQTCSLQVCSYNFLIIQYHLHWAPVCLSKACLGCQTGRWLLAWAWQPA